MWYTTSSGRIEIELTLEQANQGSHQGECYHDIHYLRTIPEIEIQLNEIDKEVLIKELQEYGAWEIEELQDHGANLDRILWLACGNIVENLED